MPSRYGGRKVRRSKNLYKLKKSGFRKAVEAAVLGAVVVGLAFVGYIVADTIFNYKEKIDDVDLPIITTGDNNSEGTPAQTQDTEQPHDEPPPPVSIIGGMAVYAPSNVLGSSASLSAFIESVKTDGFDSVVIEMKDEEGRLLYKSAAEIIPLNSQIVTGTLTAEQIASACTAAGLRPIARISTLKDHTAPGTAAGRIPDVSYKFLNDGWDWYHGDPNAGGKPWASPFLQGTVDYTAQITAELFSAGFADVIFANTIFPIFFDSDAGRIGAHITNPEQRFPGLMNFVNAVSSDVSSNTSQAQLLLEMALGCFADGTPRGTAEILRNGGDSLDVSAIVLIFTRNDLESDANISIENMVKQAFTTVSAHSGELEIVPLLDGANLSDNDRSAIIAAFSANGYENYIIRN
jgi:hypothetical protein